MCTSKYITTLNHIKLLESELRAVRVLPFIWFVIKEFSQDGRRFIFDMLIKTFNLYKFSSLKHPR